MFPVNVCKLDDFELALGVEMQFFSCCFCRNNRTDRDSQNKSQTKSAVDHLGLYTTFCQVIQPVSRSYSSSQYEPVLVLLVHHFPTKLRFAIKMPLFNAGEVAILNLPTSNLELLTIVDHCSP